MALCLAAGSATADPSISSKQAQAQAVLDQIREMDSQLSHAIEAYNGASVELERLDGELRTNARHLGLARSSLTTAQAHIAERLRSLYVNGGTGGVVEVVLGAESLDDVLNRLDAVDRVGEQDARVLREVKQFKREVQTRKKSLETARARQAVVVSERAAQKQAIEGQLAERQRLLDSIRDEIAELEEAERRRAAQAAAAARARLAAQASSARISSLERQSTESSDYVGGDTAFGLAAPPDASRASQAISVAMQYLGVPYVWGGMSPSGFDCSGLIAYVFNQVGVYLPHQAAAQFGYGTPVSLSELQPGDLVFFDGLGHAGIYVGGGSFIHAPHTGDVVKISSISGWYADRWVGGRRIL